MDFFYLSIRTFPFNFRGVLFRFGYSDSRLCCYRIRYLEVI